MPPQPRRTVSPGTLVALVCGAQVLAQLGAFFWPALLPGMMTLWDLSNSQAGWITAAFYAAYMVSVPVLVTLTDRFDGIHSLELNGMRGWVVAFLAFAAANTGTSTALVSPAAAATILGLVGTIASVAGNELAIRLGRRLLIAGAMMASLAIASVLGFVGAQSYPLAVLLVLLYSFVTWLDSASLTAGAAGTADPARRDATLAVHSTLGYAGGFVGPLAIGWTLDLSGGMSPFGWGMAFLVIAILVLVSLVTFLLMRPMELAGDRGERGL